MAFPITNNAIVVVRHNFGSSLRIDPKNFVDASGNGGFGQFARWRLHYCGIKESCSSNSTIITHQIKLQSTKSNKYLRIYPKDNKNIVNVGGSGGKWTLFNCHKINNESDSNDYILESNELPGTFLNVNNVNNNVLSGTPILLNDNINNIGEEYHFKMISLSHSRSEGQEDEEKTEISGELNGNNVKNGGIYVIEHEFNHSLRIKPNNKTGKDIDCKGGKGRFARWKVDVLPDGMVKFQNLLSRKYLRIICNGNEVDVGGSGGIYTVFKLKEFKNDLYYLESNLFCKCLGVKKDDNHVYSFEMNDNDNNNDKISMRFKLIRINVPPSSAPPSSAPQFHRLVKNGGTIESQKLREKKAGFDLPYKFHINSLIMFSHFNNDHRNVRVVPKDGNDNYKFVDGNGIAGPFTKWIITLQGNDIVKLQNAHSKGYLRICGNKDNLRVDACGGGGKYTRLKIHFLEKRNIVKLESIVFPGNFIGVTNNDLQDTFVVKNDENNNECKFEFKRTINGPKQIGEISGNHKNIKQMKCISETKGHEHSNRLITQQAELISQQNKIIQDLQYQLTNQNKIIMKLHEQISKILLQTKCDSNTFGVDEGNNESPGCKENEDDDQDENGYDEFQMIE